MINGYSSYAVALTNSNDTVPVIPSTKGQVFVNSGTGVEGIAPQYLVPIMELLCNWWAWK